MRVGDYLVMRYATIIGYSNTRKIVSVVTRRWNVDRALEAAASYRRGMPGAAFWIAQVGHKAHRRA